MLTTVRPAWEENWKECGADDLNGWTSLYFSVGCDKEGYLFLPYTPTLSQLSSCRADSTVSVAARGLGKCWHHGLIVKSEHKESGLGKKGDDAIILQAVVAFTLELGRALTPWYSPQPLQSWLLEGNLGPPYWTFPAYFISKPQLTTDGYTGGIY